MKRITICTIVSSNYLANAVTLCDSVKKYHPEIDFNILIVDKCENGILKSNDRYYIHYVQNIGIPEIEELAFKYDVIGFNTAVKPFFIEYLYLKKGYDSVIYLDPDMMLFNRLDLLIDLLADYSIILTPHICENRYKEGTTKENDFLHSGIYNLGFIATKNDSNTFKMLDWWKERLKDQCFMDITKGLAWDQKWMDFAPALFDGVYILRDLGYNMAHWNMHERFISKNENEYIINEKYKLAIYHFSQYRISETDIIYKPKYGIINNTKAIKMSERPDLKEIYDIYRSNVISNGYKKFSVIPYGFNHFDNGTQILKIHRMLYNGLKVKFKFYKNPFNTTEPDSFYKWLIREKYIKKAGVRPVPSKELKIDKKQIELVINILKIGRTILGVESYCNLLKKMNWASNISNHDVLYLLTHDRG